MRRLGLLTVSICVLVPACARDNPAFDSCETDAACVDESGNAGDGDGDTGDGDGDPGDGDGDTGDGDGDTGDGDGDTGDGDGEPGDGDGDGDPGLPSCPDGAWVSLPVEQDTFLDGSEGQSCIVDWDFEGNVPIFNNDLAGCGSLNFGASPAHWACNGDGCNSMWLGTFALAEWTQMPVQVLEAGFEFTVQFKSEKPNAVLAYELDVANVDFGNCLDWHAGDGQGSPPTDCDTTFLHAAHPNLWPVLPNDQVVQDVAIAAANLLPSGQLVQTTFWMPVAHGLVQGWLSDPATHRGVLLSSGALSPAEFYLFGQGSGHDPKLKVRLCAP
jgi:hypothetical protein